MIPSSTVGYSPGRHSLPPDSSARGPEASKPVVVGGSSGSQRVASGDFLVKVNAAGTLANAAEELTASLASRVHAQKAKERKATDSAVERPDRQRLQLMLRQWVGQGADDSSEMAARLQRLAERIARQPSTARQEVVEEFGGDASAQYLVMWELSQLFQEGLTVEDPGGSGHAHLLEALEELAAEKGASIQADFNTFEATAQQPQLQAQAFRQAYKDVVLGTESLADAGRHLLKATTGSSGEDFMAVLASMRAALGLDLAAIRHSTDPARLKALLVDLHNLEIMSTVVDRCQELSRTLQQRHGCPPLRTTALASDLVALSGERWIDSMRVLRLGESHGSSHSLSAAVDLLTGMRQALRELPVWAFQSEEARLSVLTAAQDAIDHAIDREEGIA